MNETKVVQPLLTSRLVWGALMFSTLVYGLILFTTGKTIIFTIPSSYTGLEIAALLMNLLLFVTFNIHEKKIVPERSMEKRFSSYVVCWALHELIVVMAFVAVFLSGPGNIMIYGVNLIMSWFGNVITFPRVFKQ